ncbi:MAG: hypothetical protein HF314_03420 [Ignavibacteria bacterium]|jgi:parvulin-like peptidyl-prolyl isomerase|nr:hypothetical protein [Ignavibacteria bacterium]MCU7502100.1 hypothetical protein [Ignavibacteria bacterium]MCU7515502.1 hypothetical protein [Ignavibacteria bacterium]
MKKYLLFAALLGISINTVAQVEDQVVAKVGNRTINASDIKERFALTPWPRNEKDKYSDDPKTDFLYTLIAEKLLAQKAQELGYDSSAIMNSAFKTVEKMYVRDALYKHEISSKINITNGELDKAVQKNRYKLKLECLKAKDEKGIKALYSSLRKGVPFNTLLEKNSALAKDSLLEVSFGDVESSVEEMLFSLKPGKYTEPVHGLDGWMIFRLVKRIDRYANPSQEREKVVSEARKILKQRANDAIYQSYYKKFFAGRKTEADGYMFWSFADKMIKVLQEKQRDTTVRAKDKPYVTAADFLKIEKQFGPDSLNMTFVHLDSDPVTLKQFIEQMAYDGFVGVKVDPRVLRIQLEHRVKGFIENEFLAREGFKMGLQNLPEVKNSIQMWRDSYLAQLIKSHIMDSVTANPGDLEALRAQLEGKDRATDVTMVNIVEVLTDSLETVEKVLDEIKSNKDIHELARKYTKREWTKEKGGEFGFFPSTMYGEIGRIAAKMKVGEVYGPLKTEDGYSIFKLIDKKKEEQGPGKSKTEKNSLTTRDLIDQKYLQKLNGYTASLAQSYGVTVNKDVFNSIEGRTENMLAYRYMGFGGRIMEVPFTVPFSSWVKSWLKGRQDMP